VNPGVAVPPSPSRIAPASLTPSRGGEIRVDELLGASIDDGVRGGTSHQVPAGAPGARSSTSTAMAGRGRLPPKEHVELLGIGAVIEGMFDQAELNARMHPGDKALVDGLFDGLFGDGASETVHNRAAAADPELDEIRPRSPQQQAGAARTWSEMGAGADTEPRKRRTLNRATETNESRVGSGPFVEIPVRDLDDDTSGSQSPAIHQSTAATRRLPAPEAAKVLELAERVMPESVRQACDNLGLVLTSVQHPGIPESMRKSLSELVCQEWDRAFGPQAQDVGPRCPTIGDLGDKSRLQGLYVSTRLLAEGKLCQLPPGMGSRGRLPAPTAPLRNWNSHLNQARDALCLICAAKANGMTDAEVTAFAKEKVNTPNVAFMRRIAHSGESNLAMVHALYGLDSVSMERRRSTPELSMNQNFRSAFALLAEVFEETYGDPGPSGVAARAALREWLPPSLKNLLHESDNPARLEMATLLMEAANAGHETLGNVCSYLIMATDASPDRRSALMALAKRGPQLVKLRDRLQELPAP
jgi:hypothetical protein